MRYRKISGEIRKFEAMLYVINWETALARLAEAEAELADAEAALRRGQRRAGGGGATPRREAAGRLPALRDAGGCRVGGA